MINFLNSEEVLYTLVTLETLHPWPIIIILSIFREVQLDIQASNYFLF